MNFLEAVIHDLIYSSLCVDSNNMYVASKYSLWKLTTFAFCPPETTLSSYVTTHKARWRMNETKKFYSSWNFPPKNAEFTKQPPTASKTSYLDASRNDNATYSTEFTFTFDFLNGRDGWYKQPQTFRSREFRARKFKSHKRENKSLRYEDNERRLTRAGKFHVPLNTRGKDEEKDWIRERVV